MRIDNSRSLERFLRIDLPPVLEIDCASEKTTSGWLSVAGPLRRECFVRINDGSFICSGHGGDWVTIRVNKLLGGGQVAAIDDLGEQAIYRIRPIGVAQSKSVDSTGATGSDFVTTGTGRVIDLREPDPQMICADDIAAELSQAFRKVPDYSEGYSAAQRALLATEIVCGPLERPDLAFPVLHLRSHEAYWIGDVAPFLSGSATIRSRMEEDSRSAVRSAIARAFEMQPVSELAAEDAMLIEQAHSIALAMETQRLTPGAFEIARQTLDLQSGETQLVPNLPRPMEPRQAELAFLRLHGQLVG
ncbi:MAG: hypothetical protein WCJ63_04195 [Actinomycetes bacterium]